MPTLWRQGADQRPSVPFALLGGMLWDRCRLELEGYRLKRSATRLNHLPVKNRHGTARLVNLELDESVRLGPNWRVGGGWRAVRYRVDDDRFSGPQLYQQAGF